jgi:hypothetical protein
MAKTKSKPGSRRTAYNKQQRKQWLIRQLERLEKLRDRCNDLLSRFDTVEERLIMAMDRQDRIPLSDGRTVFVRDNFADQAGMFQNTAIAFCVVRSKRFELAYVAACGQVTPLWNKETV